LQCLICLQIFETPIRHLEKLEQHDAFREASNRAKQLRSGLAGDASCVIKVMFAETEFDAEDLLNQVRVAVQSEDD